MMNSNNKQINNLVDEIIDAAKEVHADLGPGLTADIYRDALVYELTLRDVKCREEVSAHVTYKGIRLGSIRHIDIIVEDEVVIDIKSVLDMQDVFLLQLNTSMRLTGMKQGILINFNVADLSTGIWHRTIS
ncbi:MAG: GxxExxY protein [Bacteroidales bacterium]|nr:GxxExxY protein [Candidatus Sodaliphilus aphodohippi]